MAFHGLFVGIDRHSSAEVQDLSCAARDARALSALFTDTLGGEIVTLLDGDATLRALRARLSALAACDPEDTVVIGFSGHGTDDHRLVAHDTDPRDLDGTALSLDDLQTMFSRIPARRLVLLLDCCFAGGIGARVLSTGSRDRGIDSVEARLARLAGDGRLIVTAAAADQPAVEHMRHGHGLLTYFLIEALTGAEEVRDCKRLPVLALLGHVAERVTAAAAAIGRRQTPTIRGALDANLAWPVFVRAARWAEAFPDTAPAKVTADLDSLAGAGFPTALIEAWAGAIPALNDLQVSAVNDFGLLMGEHLVVSAPTSSGKTMIGELAALRTVLARRRAIFLLPLKALVADKRRHFEAVYGQFGVRTIEATGETDDIGPLLRGKFDIALLTYEKFAAIALSFPHVLEQAGVVVVDEAQMIADDGRGANLEFLLTLVRMRRRQGVEPQLIALSAVIGDTGGLEDWLGARLPRRTERPVPLDEGLLLSDGSFRHLEAATGREAVSQPLIQREWRKGTSQDWVVPLVRDLVGKGQQVIVFREQKGQARGTAGYLSRELGLPPADTALARLPANDPSQASHALREALAGGVAFHHSDLTADERRAVEEEFRRPNSSLRVIAATTTLAMGINTPASSVVICGLQHPLQKPYSVAEYKNLVGRAGRLGYAERGASYLLAPSPLEEEDLWRRYVTASLEDLSSRFLDHRTDPRSLILRVAANASRMGAPVRRADVAEFLEASLGAFQRAREAPGWRWDAGDLADAIGDLVANELLGEDEDGRLTPTELGRVAGDGGAEVETVLRLVRALRGLAAGQVTDPTLVTAVQAARELDDVHFPMNRRSVKPHHQEPQAWTREIQRQGVPRAVTAALHRDVTDECQPTLRAKKAVSCLMFVSGQPMEDIEASLTQFGGARDGAAGAIRAAAGRTCDLLPAAARVAAALIPDLDLEERVQRLLVRLTHGVTAAIVDVAREAGTGLSRGDYIALERAGLVDKAALATASDDDVARALGGDRRSAATARAAAASALERDAGSRAPRIPLLQPYVG